MSQRGECVYGAQLLKEKRLLCESAHVLIDERALILKMADREVFLMKPKHPYPLSRWWECIYGAQSWNKSKVLHESRFFPFEKWTLILKMVE